VYPEASHTIPLIEQESRSAAGAHFPFKDFFPFRRHSTSDSRQSWTKRPRTEAGAENFKRGRVHVRLLRRITNGEKRNTEFHLAIPPELHRQQLNQPASRRSCWLARSIISNSLPLASHLFGQVSRVAGGRQKAEKAEEWEDLG